MFSYFIAHLLQGVDRGLLPVVASEPRAAPCGRAALREGNGALRDSDMGPVETRIGSGPDSKARRVSFL